MRTLNCWEKKYVTLWNKIMTFNLKRKMCKNRVNQHWKILKMKKTILPYIVKLTYSTLRNYKKWLTNHCEITKNYLLNIVKLQKCLTQYCEWPQWVPEAETGRAPGIGERMLGQSGCKQQENTKIIKNISINLKLKLYL